MPRLMAILEPVVSSVPVVVILPGGCGDDGVSEGEGGVDVEMEVDVEKEGI